MKIVIAFLLCAAIADANILSRHTREDPGHLDSKVSDEKPAHQGEYKYVASLQLNASHICSSGMFQMGFLLTTVGCAWHLGKAIKEEEQRATAVFANPDSRDGQRIYIHKIAYCSRHNYYENDIGIIMLVNNYDHSLIQVSYLRPEIVDLRRYGPEASVCGWATDDPLHNIEFEKAKLSDNLHCMAIKLYGKGPCYKNIPFGDYKRRLMCGTSNSPKEILTMKHVGSPVTKIIQNNGEDRNFIVGVTIRPYVHENVTFHRLIRISLVFDDIRAIVEELESKTKADEACDIKYQDLMEESDKLRKHINLSNIAETMLHWKGNN